MQGRLRAFSAALAISVCLLVSAHVSFPQTATKDRITRAIDRSSSQAIKGHLHPKALARYDRGKVADLFAMDRVTMIFKRTEAQQAELNALLEEQQYPSSANYHRWLMP